MLQEIYDHTKTHMEKSIEALRRDFLTLRSGKVSVNILDNIKVDYYGTPTPLNQVGSVIAQDATTLVVTPWEKSLLKEIERSIQEANIGVNPNSDGEAIKLFFPPMTQEQRKEIAKEEDLKSILGLKPGAVSPLGILNDTGCKVSLFLDEDFMAPPHIIGIHPNENTATVNLKAEDLVHIITAHGNTVRIVQF